MTVTYQNNGNGTIDLTIFYNDIPKSKADSALEYAARFAYENMSMGDHGTPLLPKTWADLTNNQRLQLIGPLVRKLLKDLADDKYEDMQIEALRVTVISQLAGNLNDLG